MTKWYRYALYIIAAMLLVLALVLLFLWAGRRADAEELPKLKPTPSFAQKELDIAIRRAQVKSGSLRTALPQLQGWWRLGSQYLPCTYTPYTTWTDPVDATLQYYARYDASPYQFFGAGTPPGRTSAGQGGPNHTDQGFGYDGFLYPYWPGDHPAPTWRYPGPSAPANVCDIYFNYSGNVGQTCPNASMATYSYRISGNPVWVESFNVYKKMHDADCTGAPPPPTRTPTPVAAKTPTPVPTVPANCMGNPAFTVYDEALARAGVTSGCGGGKFCPCEVMTREQAAVWLAIAMQYPILPCEGRFTDAPCPPTPTPTVHP